MAYSELAGSEHGRTCRRCSSARSSHRCGRFEAVVGRLGRGQVDDDHAVEPRSAAETRAGRACSRSTAAAAGSAANSCIAGPARPPIVAPQLARRAGPDPGVDGRQLVAGTPPPCWNRARGSPCRSRSSDSTSVPSRISCPPTTNESQAAKSQPGELRQALTRPTVSVSCFWSAMSPSVAVAATPPRAPMNQMPMRGGDIFGRALGGGSRDLGVHPQAAARWGHLEANQRHL